MEVKRKLNWKSKVGIGLILIFVIILVYMGILVLISFRKIDMPVVFYTSNEYNKVLADLWAEYIPLNPQRTNQEYKELIEEELDLNFYIYCEAELEWDSGLALSPIRTIIIDKGMSGYKYCLTFIHEAIHFKKNSLNEAYLCFETFKYLYENKDIELHNFGVRYAIMQLRGDYEGEYNCHNQIIGYLRSKTANGGCLFYLY